MLRTCRRLPQRFGSSVVLGRYPGSRALTHRLPAPSRSGVSDASTLAYRSGGSTGIAPIKARSPVSRLTSPAGGRHSTADKRRQYTVRLSPCDSVRRCQHAAAVPRRRHRGHDLNERRARALLWLFAAACVAVLPLSLMIGSVRLDPVAALSALLAPGDRSLASAIVSLRLPRAVIAISVGGLLALSGALLQALLRNPLADPYVLGIS